MPKEGCVLGGDGLVGGGIVYYRSERVWGERAICVFTRFSSVDYIYNSTRHVAIPL